MFAILGSVGHPKARTLLRNNWDHGGTKQRLQYECGPVRLAIREARAEEASGKARGCAGFSTTKDTKIMNTQQAANLLSIGLEITDKRRMKKGHIKVRDLQPEKDVKGGGGGVTGKSTPTTGGTSTSSTGSH